MNTLILNCPKCNTEITEENRGELSIKINTDNEDRHLDYMFCKVCAYQLFLKLNGVIWSEKTSYIKKEFAEVIREVYKENKK